MVPPSTTENCLTDEELTIIRRAYEQYGTGDAFWMTEDYITEQAIARLGCSRKRVNDEIRQAFKEWSRTDPRFL